MHFPKAFLSLTEQVKEKPDKGPEHLHGKVSFATKLANAGSDSGGGGGANGRSHDLVRRANDLIPIPPALALRAAFGHLF